MVKKVMLADGDESVTAIVSATLGSDGRYTLITARDGLEAEAMARQEKPDLLFLDMMMPGKNGFEVCKALKMDAVTSSIKIVMLTTSAQESDREKGLEAGADDYFTKPFSPTAMLRKVDEVLGIG